VGVKFICVLYYVEKIDCRENVNCYQNNKLQHQFIKMEIERNELEKEALNVNTSVNKKKRSYIDAFGEREYDKERYGQEIDEDFFEINVGHGVYTK